MPRLVSRGTSFALYNNHLDFLFRLLFVSGQEDGETRHPTLGFAFGLLVGLTNLLIGRIAVLPHKIENVTRTQAEAKKDSNPKLA
jgi:hypothetical protein